jgi:hypothetical protein
VGQAEASDQLLVCLHTQASVGFQELALALQLNDRLVFGAFESYCTHSCLLVTRKTYILDLNAVWELAKLVEFLSRAELRRKLAVLVNELDGGNSCAVSFVANRSRGPALDILSCF